MLGYLSTQLLSTVITPTELTINLCSLLWPICNTTAIFKLHYLIVLHSLHVASSGQAFICVGLVCYWATPKVAVEELRIIKACLYKHVHVAHSIFFLFCYFLLHRCGAG